VLPLLPIDPDFVYKTEKSYPQFAHKRVDFFGVSPLILGSTPISRRINRQQGGSEIAFVHTQDAVHLALKSTQIWAPTGLIIPGFKERKDNHFGYRKYERVLTVPYLPELSPGHQVIVTPYQWREVKEISTCSTEYLLHRARQRNDHKVVSGLPQRNDEEYIRHMDSWEKWRVDVPKATSYSQQYREGELFVGLGRPWHFEFAQDKIMKELVVFCQNWTSKEVLRTRLLNGIAQKKVPIVDRLMKEALFAGVVTERGHEWKSNWGLT